MGKISTGLGSIVYSPVEQQVLEGLGGAEIPTGRNQTHQFRWPGSNTGRSRPTGVYRDWALIPIGVGLTERGLSRNRKSPPFLYLRRDPASSSLGGSGKRRSMASASLPSSAMEAAGLNPKGSGELEPFLQGRRLNPGKQKSHVATRCPWWWHVIALGHVVSAFAAGSEGPWRC